MQHRHCALHLLNKVSFATRLLVGGGEVGLDPVEPHVDPAHEHEVKDEHRDLPASKACELLASERHVHNDDEGGKT